MESSFVWDQHSRYFHFLWIYCGGKKILGYKVKKVNTQHLYYVYMLKNYKSTPFKSTLIYLPKI